MALILSDTLRPAFGAVIIGITAILLSWLSIL